MKKVIFILIVVIFTTVSVTKVSSNSSKSILFLQNVEAIASGADMTEPGGTTGDPCCKNGYKKWKETTNVPTQRKESFKDCWCNSKEGYDPQNCEC